MLDKQYPSQLAAKAKRWCSFTILLMIALACASCSDTTQQTSLSRGGTVQHPRTTEGARLPLTDSVSPQKDLIPTPTPASAPTPIPAPALKDLPRSYEAEAPENTLAGGARVIRCGNDVCSGGDRVGDIGLNAGMVGTLQFNNVAKNIGGLYTLTIYYIIAGSDKLALYISVNGGPEVVLNVASTANGDTVGTASIAVNLSVGNNTIEFSNSSVPAPDIDRIVV